MTYKRQAKNLSYHQINRKCEYLHTDTELIDVPMANGENKQNKTHKVILATLSLALHVPITTEENKKTKPIRMPCQYKIEIKKLKITNKKYKN